MAFTCDSKKLVLGFEASRRFQSATLNAKMKRSLRLHRINSKQNRKKIEKIEKNRKKINRKTENRIKNRNKIQSLSFHTEER